MFEGASNPNVTTNDLKDLLHHALTSPSTLGVDTAIDVLKAMASRPDVKDEDIEEAWDSYKKEIKDLDGTRARQKGWWAQGGDFEMPAMLAMSRRPRIPPKVVNDIYERLMSPRHWSDNDLLTDLYAKHLNDQQVGSLFDVFLKGRNAKSANARLDEHATRANDHLLNKLLQYARLSDDMFEKAIETGLYGVDDTYGRRGLAYNPYLTEAQLNRFVGTAAGRKLLAARITNPSEELPAVPDRVQLQMMLTIPPLPFGAVGDSREQTDLATVSSILKSPDACHDAKTEALLLCSPNMLSDVLYYTQFGDKGLPSVDDVIRWKIPEQIRENVRLWLRKQNSAKVDPHVGDVQSAPELEPLFESGGRGWIHVMELLARMSRQEDKTKRRAKGHIIRPLPETMKKSEGEEDDEYVQDVIFDFLLKHSPTPTFPKLGLGDDRRETPYVTGKKQLYNKEHLMTVANANHPKNQDLPKSYLVPRLRELASAKYNDMVHGWSGTRGATSPGSTNVQTGYVRAGDVAPLTSSANAQTGTKLHEDLHMLMNRVEHKHGREARSRLGENLYYAIPPQYREAVDQVQKEMAGDSYGRSDVQHEEKLARLINFMNSDSDRRLFHNSRNQLENPDYKPEVLEQKMKLAYKALQAAAGTADQSWLTHMKLWRSEGALKKNHPSPTFPKLAGSSGSTPHIVHTQRQISIKHHAAVNGALQGIPQVKDLDDEGKRGVVNRLMERHHRASQDAGGVSAQTVSGPQTYSLGTPSATTEGTVTGGQNSDLATAQHENLHHTLGLIEQRHGKLARQNLVSNLWTGLGSLQEPAEAVANAMGVDRTDPKFMEEGLAHIYNYVNDPHFRSTLHPANSDPAHVRAFHGKLKHAYRAIQNMSELADETWLKDPFASAKLRVERQRQQVSPSEKYGHDLSKWPKGEFERYRDYHPFLKSEVSSPLDSGIAKSEANKLAGNSEVVQDMQGFVPQAHSAFTAALFLSGSRTPVAIDVIRRALHEYDDDMEAAALSAYGMEVNDRNRQALKNIQNLQPLNKAEAPLPHISSVAAAVPEGEDTAKDVEYALKEGDYEHVTLGGRHSAGSMLMHGEKETWLLKPGSGPQSPAAGARQDNSSQSAREVAFWHVAEAWGIGDSFPRADLLIINGQYPVAAIHMLSYTWKNALKVDVKEPARLLSALNHYREHGIIHQWAVIDFILGNPDRHGQNLMVSEDDSIKLIDHGSAFAGTEFDPAHDQNSFVPFYLRAWVPQKKFNKMPASEKLRVMPTVNVHVRETLKAWVDGLDGSQLADILAKYGIDSSACLARLNRVKALAADIDEAINRLWVTV
jgi:hypothetical protein